MNRRRRLGLFGLLAVLALSPALAAPGAIDVDAILNDPAAPVAGNAAGDVTIVAYMGYDCALCRQSAADLERLVKEDNKLRLVYKEWPTQAASTYGATLALAAKYQGKYQDAHVALMGLHADGVSESDMRDAVKAAGVNMERLDEDLKAHAADIAALIQRDKDQAESLGLQSAPVYLIGPFEIAKPLKYDEFKEIVADFRARIAK